MPSTMNFRTIMYDNFSQPTQLQLISAQLYLQLHIFILKVQ
jgi:hypothetical protein